MVVPACSAPAEHKMKVVLAVEETQEHHPRLMAVTAKESDR
jgi:hypothetical protein